MPQVQFDLGLLLGGRGTLNNAVFTPGLCVDAKAHWIITNKKEDNSPALLAGPSIGFYRYSSNTSFPLGISIQSLNKSSKLSTEFQIAYAITQDSKFRFDPQLHSKNGFFLSAGLFPSSIHRTYWTWKINLDLIRTGVRYEGSLPSDSNSTFVFIRLGCLFHPNAKKAER